MFLSYPPGTYDTLTDIVRRGTLHTQNNKKCGDEEDGEGGNDPEEAEA
jgi:hypothetical protein